MDQNVYHITDFARKANVSVRTLRYYDKQGLLSPIQYDGSGYKLYTDEDFIHLQTILSFKFLGFSLKEIQGLLSGNQQGLQQRLSQQKEMLKEKRIQIEQIIGAIERIEKSLQSENFHYETIKNLIQVTQMDLRPEWVNKYLTTDERKTMREIAQQSYPKEALKKLAERGWTEEDHQQHLKDYLSFRTELTRLVNEGFRVDSPEALELARFLMEMNKRYSQNDPQIKEGMKQSWEKFNQFPEKERPKTYMIPEKEREFIQLVCLNFHKNGSY
ncbi:MAG: MerR family transcriptional regulator [Bacillota bacterium]|nr:MerR family transcriptional regulator [Bacillota bacterium]